MDKIVFISYRQSDVGQALAGRIANEIAIEIGRDCVFIDNSSIAGGEEWEKAILRALDQCDVFIPLIGSRWLDQKLADPNDWIRREIEIAIQRNIFIMPILLDGANPPQPKKLPDEIIKLANLQCLYIDSRSDGIFRTSMRYVAERIATEIDCRRLRRRNERNCELKITKPFASFPRGTAQYTWDVFLDNSLLFTLRETEESKADVIPIGHHTIKIEYHEREHDRFAGQASGWGSAGYQSSGTSSILSIYLSPGKYEFTLRKDNSTFWQTLVDTLYFRDTAQRHLHQLKFELWETKFC